MLRFGGEREAVSKVGLTAADLVAARLREPAAVTRIYTAYAPALFRFFMASVGDRHLAEDLTGNTFVSAIEDLPKFRGPVEALGGWLFQIARHDLYDHRRKQSRSRTEPLEENLAEAAASDAAVDPEDLAIARLEGGQLVPEAVGRLHQRGKLVGELDRTPVEQGVELIVEPVWLGPMHPHRSSSS